GLWGAIDTVLAVAVGPEGTVVIPSTGVTGVAGLSLEEASAKITADVQRVLPTTDVTVTLLRLGTFRIELTGLVARPGGYPMTGVQRLQDLLTQAGGILSGGSHRYLELRYRGAMREIDLVQWFLHGDLEHNPLLKPGMRVHVPGKGPTFRLRGPIAGGFEPYLSPAGITSPSDRLGQPPQVSLEWREGDTVASAIQRAGGLTPEAGENEIYVWRRASGAEDRRIPEAMTRNHSGGQPTPVYPGDLIDIPYREEWVAVTGAVHRPGRYAFVAGWKVEDYVNAAGGTSSVGKRSGWNVRRQDLDEREIERTALVAPGDIIRVPETRTHKLSTLLATASSATALLISIVALTRN
ncbi:MAG: hypothetical protein GF355_17660, partial [Candidatus Eisenbacteria bacterium]|nr:hypothetical protein [Candidatus Eisenbacteria bacterium]